MDQHLFKRHKEMNNKLAILVIIFAMSLVLSAVVPASAETLSVDGSNFTVIQAAVDIASAGDTILVYPGVYYENVVVNKPVTLRGIDRPIVDANGNGNAITLCADGITIEGFNVTNSGSRWGDVGIKVTSNSNIVTGNNVRNNAHGIHIYKACSNTITNNNVCSSKYYGIALFASSINAITDNDISENDHAIDLYSSGSNTITNNNVHNNSYGIRLDESSGNNITDNTVSSNNYDGVRFQYSDNNKIARNTVSNNHDGGGFNLRYYSNNNTISGNTVSNNRYGIRLYEFSNNNTITGNTLNNSDGIELKCSNVTTITSNTFLNGALFVSRSSKNKVEGNIVNGKPLVYLEDTSDTLVSDAGQVILVNCTNITVENLDLSDIKVGVELWKTENSSISNNKISNNSYGICICYSSNNNIVDNIVRNNYDGIDLDKSGNNYVSGNKISNNKYGINLENSCNNTFTSNNISSNNRCGIAFDAESNGSIIYLNNFINNYDTVSSFYSSNIWNSTEEIAYVYNGTTHKSYLGNYWADYEEKYPDADEINSTGIWAVPYSIDMDSDFYPLTMRFENYVFFEF
ncbi:CASH domain-dontaining protein [Methanophagales archaeon]|nr:CASH domain-dontaining protein [Methanophagales archaeon]